MKQLHPTSCRRAHAHVQKSRLRPLILALCGAGYASMTMAQLSAKDMDTQRLPDVARAIHLTAEYSRDSAKLTLTQKQGSVGVLESKTQYVGKEATVEFVGGGRDSTSLWRGIGQDAAFIFGRVTAEGRLLVVNRNGIYVGGGGSVSGAGVTLSALDLDQSYIDGDYEKLINSPHVVFNNNAPLSGDYGNAIFPLQSSPVVEVAQGATVVATDGGSVLLIGERGVRNQGSISVALSENGGGGLITLAAVPHAEVDIGDSGYIKLVNVKHDEVNGRTVVNEGTIDAPNGTIELVSSGAGSGGNVFGDPTGLSGYFTEGALTGVFNSGKITAQGSGEGGQGKVIMQATGAGAIVANSGTIDVSARDARALAGSIVASAQRVAVGNDFEGASPAELIADGPTGGGQITLNNLTMFASEGGVNGEILVLSNSRLSANATDNGTGGTIKLSTMDGLNNEQLESGLYTGSVRAYGTFEAQGGVTGGDGGRLETSATVVSVQDVDWGRASIKVNARAAGFAGGLWTLYSPDITIGNLVPGANSGVGSDTTYINADDINTVLNSGASVGMSTAYEFDTKVFSGDLRIESGTQILQSLGGGGNKLYLQSGNDLVVQGGTSITSSSGSLDVALVADADENGKGSLVLDGTRNGNVDNSQVLSLTSREQVLAVAPQAIGVAAPIVIKTNGGRLDLVGAKAAPADGGALPINSQDGVRISGTTIDTQGGNGRGDVFIKGAGGAEGSDASTDGVMVSSRNGVTIDGGTTITAGNVNIIGNSQSAAGVRISDTTVSTDKGTIDIRGVSQGGTAVPSESQPIGVDIGSAVRLEAGQGNVKILGRGVRDAVANAAQLPPANGVRIDALTITTSGNASQQLTIVGQSGGSSGAGIDVVGVASPNNPEGGLHVYEQGNSSVASAADLVIGASADASLAGRALKLGDAPALNVKRVNYRPAGVSAAAEVTEAPAQAIRVGTTAGAVSTNFIIEPGWFNKAFNSKLLANPVTVIGSSAHTGQISVQDGALDGAGVVTLQNQGAGSAGISLGEQTEPGLAELNLATQGDVTQTGAIKVGTLSLVVGPQSRVTLNDPGNQIAGLSYDSNAPQPVVNSSAVPQSRADIAGYSVDQSAPEANAFVPLAVNFSFNRQTPEVPRDVRPRPFEGPDAINDLRTDVYLRGALTRMQLCTPAQTSGAQPVSVADADPLSLEWTKVRRGAQLTNCSGVQTENSCSAF